VNSVSAQRPSVRVLTEDAMHALMQVASALGQVEESRLTPLEWRTLAWSRCSLAALYGIRIDDAMDCAVLDAETGF
jgi:hypothetical protein